MRQFFITTVLGLLFCLGLSSCMTTSSTRNRKVDIKKDQPMFSELFKDFPNAQPLGVVRMERVLFEEKDASSDDNYDIKEGFGYYMLLDEAQKLYPNVMDVVNITMDEDTVTETIFTPFGASTRTVGNKYVFTGIAITYK